MPNQEAIDVAAAAVGLSRSHPSAPALDVLAVVMKGRAGRALDFADPSATHGSIAEPGGAFGQLIAHAFDRGMSADDWRACTSPSANPQLRDLCLRIWRHEVLPKFSAHFKVSIAEGKIH